MGYLLQNGGLGMAGDWIITGGRPLQGRVEVPAAKNSVLPLLAAALLCSGPVRLQNVPRLTDVEDCLALLRGVGCTAGWQGAALAVQGQPMRTDLAPEAAGRMRASILFCAPLLARHPDGVGARTLHAAAAGVEKSGKICDLRLFCGVVQHGLPLCCGRCQQQRFGSAHTGERQADLRPPQPRRGVKRQRALRCRQLPHPHLRQPLQMQVDGSCPDAAAPGQHGAHPPQPRQQRRTEQDRGPHPGGRPLRQGTPLRRPAHDQVRSLPERFTPGPLQQRPAVLHVRQPGHPLQPHRACAQQRCRQQRQHAVFRRRDPNRTVERASARDENIPCHANAPVLPKIPHGMQNEGKGFLFRHCRAQNAHPSLSGHLLLF